MSVWLPKLAYGPVLSNVMFSFIHYCKILGTTPHVRASGLALTHCIRRKQAKYLSGNWINIHNLN